MAFGVEAQWYELRIKISRKNSVKRREEAQLVDMLSWKSYTSRHFFVVHDASKMFLKLANIDGDVLATLFL